ncbi:hypothetical protein PENSTE_c004G00704 [Penicillium steckii]|uniref:Arginase n=1 Tax=Penicillium steckii TaxID=303698 RepID=A0A1V6TPE8_9EURO|nr:hypothetical protein PENSTE_c004G00704 [Penicillium steckii]
MAVSNNSELTIVLAESSAGAPQMGSELGSRAILNSGLLKALRDHFKQVHICEISAKPSLEEDHDHAGMKRPRTVSKATQSIHELVYSHTQQGRLVLTLGGDHSNAIGTLTATTGAFNSKHDRRPAVICVDAHVSINPPEASPSGNIHGMPLAFATGLATSQEKGIFDWIQQNHLIDMKKMVYIGTRDVDDEERKLIQQNGIKFFDMNDIKKHGIDSVASMALEYVGEQTPIHLSCDIDALDPEWAPSAGHLVPGGLSLQEGELVVRRVHETGNLIAMDLVEVNPTINVDGVERTVNSACALVRGAFGLSV